MEYVRCGRMFPLDVVRKIYIISLCDIGQILMLHIESQQMSQELMIPPKPM